MNWIQKYAKNSKTHWQWYKDFFHLAVFRYLITWFAIVPVFAKLLSKIPYEVPIRTSENFEMVFTLALPFHWQLLWLSSLFFVIAFILYKIFCPNFIIKYPNFNKYLDHNHSPRWVVWEAAEVIKSKSEISKFIERLSKKQYIKEENFYSIKEIKPMVENKQTVLKFNFEDKTYSLGMPIIKNDNISENLTSIAEKEIFGRFASSHYKIRVVISILLLFSLAAFGYVLIENIWAGLNYFVKWIYL